MSDPKLILGIASTVWALLAGLFVYIVKMKDKSEDSTGSTLKEIKALVTGISNTIGIMQTQLSNNIEDTKELIKDARINREKIHSLELKVGTLTQQKLQQDRELQELKRKTK